MPAHTVHALARNPVETVTIDGADYEMELGNLTIALDIQEWAEELASFRGADGEEVFGRGKVRGLAEKGIAIVAGALGEEAAERLMGGRNRLNIVRLASLISIILEVATSPGSMAAQTSAIMSFAETGDED